MYSACFSCARRSVRMMKPRIPKPTSGHLIKKHAKFIVFPCVFSTSQKNIDFDTSDDERDRGYKHFSRIHLRNSMLFQLRNKGISRISSNGAADVRSISHEQRRRRRTIRFVKSINGTADVQFFFFLKGDFELQPFELAVSKCSQKKRTTKTTADQRHVLTGRSVSPQTCDKKKMDFSR